MENELINKVNEFSGFKLYFPDVLTDILNLTDDDIFNKLIFNAKYIFGLQKILKTGNSIPDVNNLEEIKREFTIKLEVFVDELKQVLSKSNKSPKYESIFFEMTAVSFSSLMQLIEDMNCVKQYLNRNK